MTSVNNFIDVGDPGAPIGSPAWCKAAHLQLCATKRQTDLEVRHLKYGLLEFKEKERWRQLHDKKRRPFQSWEEYVQYPEPDGLGIPPESVGAIMGALNDNSLLGEVLGKREIGIEGGKPGPGRGHKTDSNTTRLGRGRDYILARLNRDDRAELAAKVRDGELSANAAAIEAKYRKKPVKQCPKCGHEW